MTVSKKQQACVARYSKAHYEEVKFRVKKGEKATLQAIAAKQGMSVNSFITAAIDYFLSNNCPMSVDKVTTDPDDNPPEE